MNITKKDLERAIDILTQTEVNMPATFAGVGKYEHADTLSRVMETVALHKEITEEELQGMFARDASSFVLNQIITTMENMGFVDVIIRGGEKLLRYNPECGKED